MTAAAIALIAGGVVTLIRVHRAPVEDEAVEIAEPPHLRMARAVLARSRDVHPELGAVFRDDAAQV
jgi:hypothetical protein